eukprot:1074402-Pyramimonas_sp.AAC.1
MKFKKVLLSEAATQARVLIVPCPCLMHPLQLIIKSGLIVVDGILARIGKSYKYFSALSKMTQ